MILITGGAGFIGSHIAEKYIKDEKVIVIDNFSRKGTTYTAKYLRSLGVKVISEDIRNFLSIYKTINEYEPRAIFHTAGQTAVTNSMENPYKDFQINTVGTVNILEAVRKSGINPKIIFCSTNKVYGEKPNKDPTNEMIRTDISPHTPYGCSKNCADLYMREYANTYGLKNGVFRMSCIYGDRQFGIEDQGWVAHFVISAILNNKISIFGDGTQIRDILYIDDLLNAYDLFIKSDIKNGVWNIGGGEKNKISLLELIEFLENELEKKINYEFLDWRPNDQKVYISDITKIKNDLDWKPKISKNYGIKQLIKWVKQNGSIINRFYKS